MASEPVRMWRPMDASAVLLMAGETNAYTVDPRDEYVFGVVTGQPMLARRGHARHLVAPGQAVAWDPTHCHTGSAIGNRPWNARLMVIDATELRRVIDDQESDHPLGEILFPDPVIREPRLIADFQRLHLALERTSTRLERDERLSVWLRALIESRASLKLPTPNLSPRDDHALRLALDHLAAHYEQNIGLDELSNIAGIGKYRLLRLCRKRTGLSPHALHIAHRIRAARRLLESGEAIAQTAAATGFADQSHLHRHFTRSLGLTPGEYQRRMI
jgi:AraC-like DNA-binding protein